MKTLRLLALLSWAAPLHAQIPIEPEWVAALPVGSSITAGTKAFTADGAGVSYLAGVTGTSSNRDVIVAAFDADGALLWSDVFDGPAAWHDQARGITLGPGGRLYVTGNTPGPGSYANVLVLAYDAATGTRLDTVQYSSAPFKSEHGASVATDALGNVYVAGGTVGDGGDVLVVKLDAAGTVRWTRTWDGPALAPYSQDNAKEVLVGPDGHPVVMVHGVMSSLHPDYVVLKLDAADGTSLWGANWGVSGGDFPRDMELDALGDVYVTGTGIDFTDKFSTIKLRGTDGVLLWQAYDTHAFNNSATAVALDGEGGVYITGVVDPDGDESNSNWDMYTIKRTADTGALVWTRLYGASCVGCSDVASDLVVDSEGHLYLAGRTSSPPYSGAHVTFVLDAATGAETHRGIVDPSGPQLAGSGTLRLDAAGNLYNGGQVSNADTGAVEMTVLKYASLLAQATGTSFCDASDGMLAACPCGNAGDPDSGCDVQQGTGGVKLDLVAQETEPQNRVSWGASGFPAMGTPAAIVVRAPVLDPLRPKTFGDGLICLGDAVVRLGAAFAVDGTLVTEHGHGAGAGAFYYQLWFRNSPALYCTPAAFNLSNGRKLSW